MKKYKRDGRSPPPKSEIVSRVMSANRGRDTGPEIRLRHALMSIGASGYRLHWRNVPGRPDIAYPGRKIAIFVNGCFWHHCPRCGLPPPKSNTEFWLEKFKKNKERDEKKIIALKKEGWRTIIVWECEINENPNVVAERIKEIIMQKK